MKILITDESLLKAGFVKNDYDYEDGNMNGVDFDVVGIYIDVEKSDNKDFDYISKDGSTYYKKEWILDLKD